jgi:hypothetical protein
VNLCYSEHKTWVSKTHQADDSAVDLVFGYCSVAYSYETLVSSVQLQIPYTLNVSDSTSKFSTTAAFVIVTNKKKSLLRVGIILADRNILSLPVGSLIVYNVDYSALHTHTCDSHTHTRD